MRSFDEHDVLPGRWGGYGELSFPGIRARDSTISYCSIPLPAVDGPSTRPTTEQWQTTEPDSPRLAGRHRAIAGNPRPRLPRGSPNIFSPFSLRRFFSSTFGYTIGEKAEGIVSLWQNSDTLKSCLRGRQGLAGDLPHADLLRWPADLPRPAGILFLSLDPAARVERIKRREESSTQVERERIVNDWDVKTKDPALAARIAYCMELLATANAVPFHSLDATVTAVEVLRKGSEIVTGGPRGGEKS